jgi:hypothetical protein
MNIKCTELEASISESSTLIKYFPDLTFYSYYEHNHREIINFTFIQENYNYENCLKTEGSLIKYWEKMNM